MKSGKSINADQGTGILPLIAATMFCIECGRIEVLIWEDGAYADFDFGYCMDCECEAMLPILGTLTTRN